MQIELTLHESDYIKHLLDTARRALLHELRHIHGDEFKDALAHQLELNEKLVRKMEPVPANAH